jgi:IS4 transposase
MCKDSEKKLVGQPIFNQVLKIIPRAVFDRIVLEQKSDRHCRAFSSWDELVTLLFGVFTRCDSAREVCDGMAALGGKLNYLCMDTAPAKSTFNDALNTRKEAFFEQFYFALLNCFSDVLSDSRKGGVSFEKFYAFDSTTISLFSDVLKGAGRNPKGDGKKKGGLKVHMLTDVHADTAKFVKMSEAKQHDKNFLKHLDMLPKGSMIAFDKAYNHYLQFARWTQEDIFFVCRLKDNAKYEVQDVMFEQTLPEGQAGVMKTEHIHLQYKEGKKSKTLCLRKVTYRDEQGRIYQFITNNWEISSEEVALIYKYRWTIELVFKKLKQNFQLHFFYSESENGIKTQIWATLIAHLLLTVLKRKSKSNKAFSTVAALIRIHLISHLDLYWVIENGRRTYAKCTKSRSKSPQAVQLSCFDGGG